MRELFFNFFISDKIPVKERNYNDIFVVYCTNMSKTEVIKYTNTNIDQNIQIYCSSEEDYLLNNCFHFLSKNKHVCIVYDLSNISIFNEFMYAFVKKNCGDFTTDKEYIDICIYNDIPFQ